MKRLAFVALVLFLFVKSPAYAQQAPESEAKKVADGSRGGTEHGVDEVFWGWANFVLLVVGLGYIVKKNAGPYFLKRSLEIRKGMIEADEARAGADAKVAEVERRLASLEAEIEALRRDARQEGAAEAHRVRHEGAAEMAKIQHHLTDEIASAGKAARLELRRYSAELALGLAEQKIAARMSPETEDRLVTSFVAHLGHP
jgi:F-type H+-transporting ATPase subunit b